MPLYGVASRCRHPKIRRKAIAILRSSSRHEGVWNAILTAKVAERVMQIEEEGLGVITSPRDVPSWARISDVEPKLDAVERKGTFTYTRYKSQVDTTRMTIEEVIEW